MEDLKGKTKTQKFFTINLVLENQTWFLGRNVIESFLQNFFDTQLKGRELAESIGNKTIIIENIGGRFTHGEQWWLESFRIKQIKQK